MKKVKVFVEIEEAAGYRIHRLYVIYRNGDILELTPALYSNDTVYQNMDDLQRYVLKLLKANNLTVPVRHNDFNTQWYDIVIIYMSTGRFEQYPLKGGMI
nr:MAG TPA: hypothetical protein [Caudoviricetes sp.]